MIQLEPIHYAAAMLHPRYRQLKMCSAAERQDCKKFIRTRMKMITAQEKGGDMTMITSIEESGFEPHPKRKRFGEEFESGNLSDEYEDDGDELDRYLAKHLEKVDFTEDPLRLWETLLSEFPLLAKIARQVFCIPATTASVERSFSHSGYIINERRTNLRPDQLNNIILLRSSNNISL
jgi:zinc finger BED domain-containing protein 1 (E3 SUMO-protein ligase ZBED1)